MELARRALILCQWFERWAPFRFHGTSLVPAHLLSAKLLVSYILIDNWNLGGEVFLPFWRGLDGLPVDNTLLTSVVWWVFHGLTILLLFNRWPRWSASGAGLVIVWGLMASRLDYSNSRLFIGLFLILIGLQDGSAWMKAALRAQLVLVYAGAALNKVLDPAWRDGSALDYFCGQILNLNHWHAMTSILPVAFFGWAVIVIEGLLAVGFGRTRWLGSAIWLGLGFHLGMLVFTQGNLSWVFLYAMAAAYVAVAPHITESPARVSATSADPKECWALLLATPHFYLGLAGLFWVAKYLW